MFDLSTIVLFSMTSFLLAITPGPDLFYIATRSITQGRSAGVVSAIGVHTGIFMHTLAAALGLSALIAISGLAFNSIKYLGAAYLIYLGIRTFLTQENNGDESLPQEITSVGLSRVYYEGIVTNVLNPQVILFFLAFLPQFVDSSSSHASFQIILLGLLFIVVTFPVDASVGLLAGKLIGIDFALTIFWNFCGVGILPAQIMQLKYSLAYIWELV